MKRKNVVIDVNGDDKEIEIIKLNELEKIKHRIVRFFQKNVIISNKKMMKDDYIIRSPDEKEGISICRDLIKNKKTELLLCPKTWERYVINDNLEIDIIISDKSIDIINHTYHYTIPICKKTHKIITNIFDGYVEKRRLELKKRIFSNIKYSLNTIHTKVKKDLENSGIK